MSFDIPLSARFLSAFAVALFATVILLGGAGYAVTRVVVPPTRDMFRTAAFELELAPGWWCELDGTEYVCSPPGKPPHSAIAIVAMKERNDKDTLAAYEDHLRQMGAGTNSRREVQSSEVGRVYRRTLGTREWVVALHAGSEIPNYDTYYLATATSYLGILVTLSVHKDYSAHYIAQMNRMMETLIVYQR
jgi:hypothetical protein